MHDYHEARPGILVKRPRSANVKAEWDRNAHADKLVIILSISVIASLIFIIVLAVKIGKLEVDHDRWPVHKRSVAAKIFYA